LASRCERPSLCDEEHQERSLTLRPGIRVHIHLQCVVHHLRPVIGSVSGQDAVEGVPQGIGGLVALSEPESELL